MISIVIPLYNKEQSIAKTLDSVLSQSYTDYECLVVNDGSTDRSQEIVEQWICTKQDNHFRLINKENGGVCSARNRGIQEAKGEYIALLDGDDLWDKDFLKEIVHMQHDFPEAGMWGINFAEMYNGKLVRHLDTGLADGYRGYVENYFGFVHQSDLFCSSSVVIRKEVFDRVGNFDERIRYAEDSDMWFRIIVNYSVAFYDRYMVFYQYDAENRAMNKKRLLRNWLPYFVDKYRTEVYQKHPVFYLWIMLWAAIRIKWTYFGDASQREDAMAAMRKLDYSVLPKKYRILFGLPYFIAKPLYLLDEWRMKQHHV